LPHDSVRTIAYDSLNNLKTVTQGVQIRTFSYDSASRLKQSVNPESGAISYSYDDSGNVTGKTDARSITASYAYDNLNRVQTRSYSDTTPEVSYFYDNLTNAKGNLIKVSSAISTTEYSSFDSMGSVLSHQQTSDGQSYQTSYSYNLSGALMEEVSIGASGQECAGCEWRFINRGE
jgi:YD repeat-containing protein